MGALFKPIAGVLRIGKNLHVYGDPYDMACTVVIDGNKAVLEGATAITGLDLVSEREALRQIFTNLGITEVVMRRLKPNKPAREVVFKLN
jgi:hypothetical protein